MSDERQGASKTRVREHFPDSVQLAGLAAGTRGWCSLGLWLKEGFMPRQPMLDPPGIPQRIMQRGNAL